MFRFIRNLFRKSKVKEVTLDGKVERVLLDRTQSNANFALLLSVANDCDVFKKDYVTIKRFIEKHSAIVTHRIKLEDYTAYELTPEIVSLVKQCNNRCIVPNSKEFKAFFKKVMDSVG